MICTTWGCGKDKKKGDQFLK